MLLAERRAVLLHSRQNWRSGQSSLEVANVLHGQTGSLRVDADRLQRRTQYFVRHKLFHFHVGVSQERSSSCTQPHELLQCKRAVASIQALQQAVGAVLSAFAAVVPEQPQEACCSGSHPRRTFRDQYVTALLDPWGDAFPIQHVDAVRSPADGLMHARDQRAREQTIQDTVSHGK